MNTIRFRITRYIEVALLSVTTAYSGSCLAADTTDADLHKWWSASLALGLHEEIWPRIEPTLNEVAQSVRDRTSGVQTFIYSDKSPNYPFSGYAQFQKRALFLFVTREVSIHFDCGFSLASLPNLERIECRSEVFSTEGGTERRIIEGPRTRLYLRDTEVQIRRDVGQWIEATNEFMRDSVELIASELR